MALPDKAGQTDTFLESILIAQDYLKQTPTVGNFLDYMLQWAGADTNISNWQKQSILNGYYLVGLIPYTFYFNGDNPTVHCTLPSLDLSELRQHCLQNLTDRLIAMPEFWWVVQTYQPSIINDFATHFVENHPFGLNDVSNRLKLLTGLGATQRMLGNRYQLTKSGRSMAMDWLVEPELEDEEIFVEEDDDFFIEDVELW
jgi:hypothetical protein